MVLKNQIISKYLFWFHVICEKSDLYLVLKIEFCTSMWIGGKRKKRILGIYGKICEGGFFCSCFDFNSVKIMEDNFQ